MIASSTIALPAVLAVISRPSRIGTPELISVDSVRQNRATAILRMMLPSTGSFSVDRVDRRAGRCRSRSSVLKP